MTDLQRQQSAGVPKKCQTTLDQGWMGGRAGWLESSVMGMYLAARAGAVSGCFVAMGASLQLQFLCLLARQRVGWEQKGDLEQALV